MIRCHVKQVSYWTGLKGLCLSKWYHCYSNESCLCDHCHVTITYLYRNSYRSKLPIGYWCLNIGIAQLFFELYYSHVIDVSTYTEPNLKPSPPGPLPLLILVLIVFHFQFENGESAARPNCDCRHWNGFTQRTALSWRTKRLLWYKKDCLG